MRFTELPERAIVGNVPNWPPRQEGERLNLAQIDQGFRVTISDAVPVLDRDNGRQPLRNPKLILIHIRHADVADLALVLQFDEGSDRLVIADTRIGAMELVEGNLVQSQSPQTSLARCLEMFGPAVDWPPVRAGPLVSPFRGDDEVIGIAVEGLGNQCLAHVRPVRIGRVDEVHTEFDRPLEYRFGDLTIRRLTPDPRAGYPHRAETEPVDRQIATDAHRPRIGRGRRVGHGRAPFAKVAPTTVGSGRLQPAAFCGSRSRTEVA